MFPSTGTPFTAAEAAAEVGYNRRNGQGNAETVRSLYRSGRFPAPIDPSLPPRMWRWSRQSIEAYKEHGAGVTSGAKSA